MDLIRTGAAFDPSFMVGCARSPLGGGAFPAYPAHRNWLEGFAGEIGREAATFVPGSRHGSRGSRPPTEADRQAQAVLDKLVPPRPGTEASWRANIEAKASQMPVFSPSAPKNFVELASAAGIDIAEYAADVVDILNKYVQIAVQLAEKIVTALMSGLNLAAAISTATSSVAALGATIVGSIVPGIGNIVGLAVTLVVAMVGWLDAPPKVFRKKCPDRTRVDNPDYSKDCGGIPPGVFVPPECQGRTSKKISITGCPNVAQYLGLGAPITVLPILLKLEADVQERILKEQRRDYCNYGGLHNCLGGIKNATNEMTELSEKAAWTLGLPELNDLIPRYEQSIRGYFYIRQLNPPVIGKKRTQHFLDNPVWIDRARNTIDVVLGAMKMRRDRMGLLALAIAPNAVASMAIGSVATLRFKVLHELGLAAAQMVNSPGARTTAWFKTLAKGATLLGEREKANIEAIAQAYREHTERTKVIEADPVLRHKLALEQYQFQCGQGDQRACARFRTLQAGGPSALLPHEGRGSGSGTAPPPGPAPPVVDLAKLAEARNQHIFDYLHRLKNSGHRNAALLIMGAAQQRTKMTQANKVWLTHHYLDRMAKSGNQPAKNILYAATKDFSDKMRLARAAA